LKIIKKHHNNTCQILTTFAMLYSFLFPKYFKSKDNPYWEILISPTFFLDKNHRELILHHVNLSQVDLFTAHLGNASLSNVDLVGANLMCADFMGANLMGVNLCRTDLFGANLRDANLTCTNLRESKLIEADLTGAHLQGAVYNKGTQFPKGFDPEEECMIKIDDD
jgi:uncharacterized protein YjbI with pentapeptide repeats